MPANSAPLVSVSQRWQDDALATWGASMADSWRILYFFADGLLHRLLTKDSSREQEMNDTQHHSDIERLYENATQNIEAAKAQQWRVVYWGMLAYAGIVGIGTQWKCDDVNPRILLTTVSGIVCLSGLFLQYRYQGWLWKQRKRLVLAISYMSAPVFDIWGAELPDESSFFTKPLDPLVTQRFTELGASERDLRRIDAFLAKWRDGCFFVLFVSFVIIGFGVVLAWTWTSFPQCSQTSWIERA